MRHFFFFLRLVNCFSLRRLRVHPWRVLAVLVGIALGAAVFTSVRLAVVASLGSFTRSMDHLSGRADWSVVKPGGQVPDRLVAQLFSDPSVESASPLLSRYVSRSKGGGEPFLLIGLDPLLDRPLRKWKVHSPPSGEVSRVWLDLLRKPDTIFLSRRLARDHGVSPGDKIDLEHVQQTSQFRVLGLLEEEGLSLVEGGLVAITDIATMQEFTGRQGWVDRIDLRVNPGTSQEELARLRSLLPQGVVLEPPTEARETGRKMIHAYQLNLSVLSFVSLFVGMFLVYSLVSLNAASGRRELAILRSLGASSGLVFALILSEGLLLGLLGWLLAIPTGAFLVKYLLQGVSSTISNLFVRVRVEGLQLDIWEVLLSFAVTLLVSLLAAYRPARESIRISPKEAMMIQGGPAGQPRPARQVTMVGLLFIGMSWPVSRLPGLAGFPLPGYLSVLLLVVGFSMLSSPILRWMGSRLAPLLRRLGGEPAFLGCRYVRDAGNRTAISVGALATAVALFVSLVIMVHSFRGTVSLWVNQTLTGDFFIRPRMAGLNRYNDPLPEEVVEALKEIKGVELFPYRHLRLKQGRVTYQLEAVGFQLLLRHGNLILVDGDLGRITERLVAGKGVLVSEVFANQTGLGTGDSYQVQLNGVDLEAPVLGVFRDYRTQGGAVYMDFHWYQRLTGDDRWSGSRFFFKDHEQGLQKAVDRLRGEILRCCGQRHPLDMASGTELRSEILKIFDETFAITTVLLLIALLVAGLGITTTLTVLVLERIRQLNTLVALGAQPGQIRTMIFWEALLMVTAGEGIGLACGFALSYILIYVINAQSFGWTFIYSVEWTSLLLSLPLILGTALLAALPAARLVLRSSPALVLKEL